MVNDKDKKCPVCNSDKYDFYSTDNEAPAPAEGYCEDCEFRYEENGKHSEIEQAEMYKAKYKIGE